MRYDANRGRLVCDECERKIARGQRPVSSGSPSPSKARSRPSPARLPSVSIPDVPKGKKPQLTLVPPVDELAKASVGPAIQAKLPIQSGKAQNAFHYSEQEIQQGSINALYARGYRVLENTVHLKRIFISCTGCGKRWWQTPSHKTGQTPGIPDLDCGSERWNHPLLPAALWLGIEQKTLKGSLSPEQRELNKAGLTVVARSPEASVAAAGKVDQFFDYISVLDALRAEVEEFARTSPQPLPAGIAAKLLRLNAIRSEASTNR